MPAKNGKHPESQRLETSLLKGSRETRRLVASSSLLMEARECLHAEVVLGRKAGDEARVFKSLLGVTDDKTIFQRCRRLAGTKGFISWVLRAKKLLFSDGMKIEGVTDAGDLARLARAVRDMWHESLIQNNVVSVWRGADEKPPIIQVLDCEGVKYEDQFGEETLRICYEARTMSAEQKKKLGTRYAEALAEGKELVWGAINGEGFKVLKDAKLGDGLGKPLLYAIFEEIALHGLLTIGDWNAAWTTKDVIRQFKKGHEIKQGNLSGLPVHFLKKTERDDIHKAMKDKVGAVDLVTNFDVNIEYPTFDFDFFKQEKYEAVRQRLMDWSGPIGLIYLGAQHQDPEAILTLLRIEIEAARAEISRHFAEVVASKEFTQVKGAKLVWNQFTMLSWDAVIKYVTFALGNGLMPPQMARPIFGIDEEEANKLMKKAHANRLNYTPVFEGKQGIVAGEFNTDGHTGGRPPDSTTPPAVTPPTP